LRHLADSASTMSSWAARWIPGGSTCPRACSLLRAQLLPRHRPLGPQRLRAASCQARRHRRTELGVTGRPRAISLIPSPQANRLAASNRHRARHCCSAGVYPPRSAYRMLRSYVGHSSATSRRHDPNSTNYSNPG
jgi:hypothetical protein